MNTSGPCAFALLWLLAAAPAPRVVVDHEAVLGASSRTVAAVHASAGRGWRRLIGRARAVLIAPDGRTGAALLLLHEPTGWSEPAFFAPGAVATGAPAMLLVMTDRATDAILRQAGLALDGPDALATATLTTRPAAADLLLWSPDAHAKLVQDGLHQDDAANAAFYGHPRNAADIVGFTPPELRSSRLRSALGG